MLRFLIDDFPDRAKFLTEQERAQIVHRIEVDRGNATTEKITLKNVKDLKGKALESAFHPQSDLVQPPLPVG